MSHSEKIDLLNGNVYLYDFQGVKLKKSNASVFKCKIIRQPSPETNFAVISSK